jgi:hypothetical protein
MKINAGTIVQTPLGRGTITGNTDPDHTGKSWIRAEVEFDVHPEQWDCSKLWFYKGEITVCH